MSRKQCLEILKRLLEAMETFDGISPSPERINALKMAIASLETDEAYQLEYESTTKNDLALIHTEGLDEGIRCAMCTNSMKSDRGCDGSCVVNNAMYKEVMDVIENHIQPTSVTQIRAKGHWIEHPHEAGLNWEYSRYECSECHDWAEDDSDYCPYCGAKMEASEE